MRVVVYHLPTLECVFDSRRPDPLVRAVPGPSNNGVLYSCSVFGFCNCIDASAFFLVLLSRAFIITSALHLKGQERKEEERRAPSLCALIDAVILLVPTLVVGQPLLRESPPRGVTTSLSSFGLVFVPTEPLPCSTLIEDDKDWQQEELDAFMLAPTLKTVKWTRNTATRLGVVYTSEDVVAQLSSSRLAPSGPGCLFCFVCLPLL